MKAVVAGRNPQAGERNSDLLNISMKRLAIQTAVETNDDLPDVAVVPFTAMGLTELAQAARLTLEFCA
jgi:hypothetical protein